MRLNSIVPNFKAETTQGPIDFYEWQGNSWVTYIILIFTILFNISDLCNFFIFTYNIDYIFVIIM